MYEGTKYTTPTKVESEVREAIHTLGNRKSAGVDNIPIELFKAGGEETIKVLTDFCNAVWKTRRWPEEWKASIFIPLFKKGDKKKCGNYRTISLISHASKILLKIIQKRLEGYRYLLKNYVSKRTACSAHLRCSFGKLAKLVAPDETYLRLLLTRF